MAEELQEVQASQSWGRGPEGKKQYILTQGSECIKEGASGYSQYLGYKIGGVSDHVKTGVT